MKLYSFKCGGDYADRALQDPLDADVGTKLYEPWTAYVVDHPQGPVLFDTGIPPEILTDPMGVLGPWGDMFDLRMDESDTIAALLATIGLEPAAIPKVVMSHLHHDHAAALPLFRHAEIYVQERELAFARNPPVYQANAYMPDQFEGDYRWQPLDGEHDLFGDGRIVLFPTPGHTAGHQSVRVTLDRDTVIVMFDATYSIDKMRERLLPGILWSPDDLVASWEKIEALEREHSAILLATHDPNVERVQVGSERVVRVTWFQTEDVGDGVTLVTEPHAAEFIRGNFFIVDCSEATLLVDSGLGLASIAAELSGEMRDPVTLVLTHAHNDHRGGAPEFDVRLAHRLEQEVLSVRVHGRTRPGDWPAENLRAARASGYTFPAYMLARSPHAGFDPDDYWLEPAPATAFVDEGDRLTIGSREFTVLHLPGHTPGGIGLIEEATGVFFSGDLLYDGPLVDGLPESNAADFAASVARIRDLPI